MRRVLQAGGLAAFEESEDRFGCRPERRRPAGSGASRSGRSTLISELTGSCRTAQTGSCSPLRRGGTAWRATRPRDVGDAVEELAARVVAGRLRAGVHTRLPLTGAAEAHRLLDDRAYTGRILLVP
ncbi:MAG TPA: zinc-binding dehydrogenase [Spirillospora sp.]